MIFIPKTAQQFNTKVYNHIASLLHVSAFFGHLQEGIRQVKRKPQHWLIM